MNKIGSIIIIDDDPDDQEMFIEVLKSLACENEVVCFGDAEKALAYLGKLTVKPFLIFCDINLPRISGQGLRKKLRDHDLLWIRCVPRLYFTTTASDKLLIDAYSSSTQGFFIKPNNMDHLQNIIKTVIDYWQNCAAPRYTFTEKSCLNPTSFEAIS